MPNTPDINTLPNGGSGSEPTTPTAVLKPPQFAADISGIAREPPTGDAIRDKCRVMLCTALKKGRSEGVSFVIEAYKNRNFSLYYRHIND